MRTNKLKNGTLAADYLDRATICVVGLGVVGLPLARAFSQRSKVVGFDVDVNKLDALNRENHKNANLSLTSDPSMMRDSDFILIAVPTPLTKSNDPDMSYFEKACRAIGPNLKRGSVVIVESSVYPGATEEIVKPILESFGLRCGTDFKLGCSPERVNPGDDGHSLDRVTKIVSGMDEETTDLVARLYSRIVPSVFKAKDIKTAEAAKLMENVQRDVNVALMNELSSLFEAMGMDTREVIKAAATKWNFAMHTPGLVGGYCIPVSPRYLMYKGKESGVKLPLIKAARETNDFMPARIVGMVSKALALTRGGVSGSRVLFLGTTYKENVPDTRNSPITDVMAQLFKQGAKVLVYDPLAANVEPQFEKIPSLADLKGVDCVVLSVAHDVFRDITLDQVKSVSSPKPVIIDIRGFFNGQKARSMGFQYKCL